MKASEYLLLAIDLCNQNLDKEDVIIELQDSMRLHGDCRLFQKEDPSNPGKYLSEIDHIYFFYNPKKIYKRAKHYIF